MLYELCTIDVGKGLSGHMMLKFRTLVAAVELVNMKSREGTRALYALYIDTEKDEEQQ
jgi:hypothetical protein